MPQTKCGFDSGPAGSGQDLLVIHGPTLQVDIGFDPAFQPGTTIPVSGVKAVPALVDTGATVSCIDDALAVSLNLPIVDRQPISGVSGRKEANMYLAQIHVPSLGFTIYGSFAGVDLIAGGQRHQALIGRTFLRRFTMIYEGITGTVTLFN
jgi:hypothetical protein